VQVSQQLPVVARGRRGGRGHVEHGAEAHRQRQRIGYRAAATRPPCAKAWRSGDPRQSECRCCRSPRRAHGPGPSGLR
jgi:hypothetical protein